MPRKGYVLGFLLSLLLVLTLGLTAGYTLAARADRAADLPSGLWTTAGQSLPQVAAAAPTTAGQQLPAAQDGLPQLPLEALYEQVNPSVVNIMVTVKGAQGATQQGEGSGFVYDRQGHIITNNHVVANADALRVTFSNDVSLPAEVVGADPDSDLAVIEVDATGLDLAPLELADSSTARVGAQVVAIGNPFGLQGSMTAGIISGLGRVMPVGETASTQPRYSIPDVIQTDAAINPGNSGGPLLNLAGQVVGVNAAIESPVRANAGVGFAIPANIVRKVVPVLIERGSYAHPYLGISTLALNPELNNALGLDSDQRGVLVAAVSPGSPAEAAGLRAGQGTTQVQGDSVPTGGDVIVGIDNVQVTEFDDLIGYLAGSTEVGQRVQLTVLRDGKTIQVALTLAARPTSR